MTSRERLLTALSNGKPDRLPSQVHCWLPYYLNKYLGGIDAYQAYDRFGIDWVIYNGPTLICNDKDLSQWVTEHTDLGISESGDHMWREVITTPEGTLTRAGAWNDMTAWETENFVKVKEDFELWRKYYPVPDKRDSTELYKVKEKVGDKGIIRSGMWGYGQPGPWQCFCMLVGTEKAIYFAMDEPEWVHSAIQAITDKALKTVEFYEGLPLDLIETGGGSASNTVISPSLHKEFCTPYDRQIHDALHGVGMKVVYHLCGGLMGQLDNVVDNHADGLETMTPPGMGGDCDLAEATRRVGDKLFFIGGFDQLEGFEKGPASRAKELVHECFDACPNGGYICSPSDHFFDGDPANIQAFADAARECTY